MSNPDAIGPDPDWSIPDTLNAVLVAVVSALSIFMLWLGSNTEMPFAWLLISGVIYSYIQLTNYALMHEAAHDKLHSRATVNYLLGAINGFFFPMSFTMFHNTHTKHHVQNRSDDELFDAYGPGDSIIKKYAQWYGILTGGFWFYPVVGSVALTVFSPETVQKWFLDDRPGRAYSGNFSKEEVRYIRIELLVFVLFVSTLFILLNLNAYVLLVYYACFAVNWSTRQFIEHAYTKRHFIEGSLNLKHFKWMSKLLLHRELDLNHHRHPSVPWIHLPKLLNPGEKQIHYIRQYLRLWAGPVPLSRLHDLVDQAGSR